MLMVSRLAYFAKCYRDNYLLKKNNLYFAAARIVFAVPQSVHQVICVLA